MSTFDDLEHDQRDALSELAGVLDLDAGLRDALGELDRQHELDDVAGALDLDAGVAAALAAVDLPTAGNRSQLESTAQRATDGVASEQSYPERRSRRSGSRLVASLLRPFVVALAAFRNLFRGPVRRTNYSITVTNHSAVQIADVHVCVNPVEPPRPPARSLQEIVRDLIRLGDLVTELRDAGGRGPSDTPSRWSYQGALDTARNNLSGVAMGLSTRNISLETALLRLDKARDAVERAQSVAPAAGVTHSRAVWVVSSLAVVATFSVFTVLLLSQSGGVVLALAIPALAGLLTCIGSFLMRRAAAERGVRAAAKRLTEERVAMQTRRLKLDVIRLFDDADEFSGSGSRLLD